MRRVCIVDICSINPRLPANLASKKDLDVDFVPMANLGEDGRISFNGSRKLGQVLKGYTYFENGDVIVAKITPCLENGKAAFVRGLPHGVAFGSTEFHVLRPNASIEGRYLFHMVWSPRFRYEAARNMTGTAGQQRVPTSFLERFEIPLPPLSEQKRIADILDIANAIQRKRQEASRWAEVLLRSSFCEWFGDPVQNRRRWPTAKLGQEATLDRGRSRHRPRDASVLYGGQYPFVQTGDVANADGYIDSYSQTYSTEGLAQSKMWPAGTLCITIAANIAKTAILSFDACFPDSVVGLVPGPRLTTEYVRYWFVGMERAIDASATQVAQKNINLEFLRNLEIQLPPSALIRRFTNLVKKVRELKRKHQVAAYESEGLFNSLVQLAFRGNLR